MPFDGVPAPAARQLTLYILGGGYGESSVLVLPDGRCMVVDCCPELSRALLNHLGISTIDLLVLTHPDLDHIGALPALIDNISVGTLWRFRAASRITELAAYWLRSRERDQRLRALYASLEAIRALENSLESFEAAMGLKPWRGDGYEIHCVAPTQYDLSRLTRSFDDIIRAGPDDPSISRRVYEFLVGEVRSLSESGNPLSLAASVIWGDVRILLAGDVLNGSGHSRSGWRGILRQLERSSELALITDLAVVKVAHHGSDGAFLPDIWMRHSGARKVRAAVIAPFDRGPNPPPHQATLRDLRYYAQTLLLTDRHAGGVETRYTDAGWSVGSVSPLSMVEPCIALQFSTEGNVTMAFGERGGHYEEAAGGVT